MEQLQNAVGVVLIYFIIFWGASRVCREQASKADRAAVFAAAKEAVDELMRKHCL